MAKLIVVDVESDGEIPYRNSMVCFGAVVVDKQGKLDQTFYGKTKPISKIYNPEALAISGFSREEHETFDEPSEVMWKFYEWLKSLGEGNKIFLSDNLAYDWQWINWYFHYYCQRNPFGFSGQRIGDKFQGFFNDPYYKWKQHRDYKFNFKHTHCPLEDCKANAAALLYLHDQGFKLF